MSDPKNSILNESSFEDESQSDSNSGSDMVQHNDNPTVVVENNLALVDFFSMTTVSGEDKAQLALKWLATPVHPPSGPSAQEWLRKELDPNDLDQESLFSKIVIPLFESLKVPSGIRLSCTWKQLVDSTRVFLVMALDESDQDKANRLVQLAVDKASQAQWELFNKRLLKMNLKRSTLMSTL